MGINLLNVTKCFEEVEPIYACRDISLSLQADGLYFVLGKSGSGKTTLLNMLSGIDTPTEGQILVDGENITEYTAEQNSSYRNLKIGIIFQKLNLIPSMSVEENLQLVLDIQKAREVNTTDLIKKSLEDVDLSGFEKRMPATLSGGEQQRVAIARCLLKEPKYIFADEPTGSLDGKNAEEVFRILRKIASDHIVVIVTHDRDSAYRYADSIIHMADGRIASIESNLQGNNKRYDYVMTDDNRTERYQNKTLSEVLEHFKNCFVRKQSFSIREIDVKKTSEKDTGEKSVASEIKKEPCKLNSVQCIRLAWAFAKGRGLLLAAIPLALAMVLLFAGIYLIGFNQNKTIVNYFEHEGIPVIRPFFRSSYINKLEETVERTISRGEILTDRIRQADSGVQCLRYSEDVNISIETDEGPPNRCDATAYYVGDMNLNLISLRSGKYPSQDEVLITNIIADTLSATVGMTIIIDGREYIVSGIVDSGIEYSTYVSMNTVNSDPYFQYNDKTRYSAVYFSENELQRIADNTYCIDLDCSDFTKSGMEKGYFYSRIGYVSETLFRDDNSLESDKSVLISRSLLQEEEKTAKEHYQFVDLSADRFQQTYADTLNLFEFFPDGVTVREVFDDDEYIGSVVISKSVFEEIRQKYYDSYYAEWYIDGKVLAKDSLYTILQSGLKIDEPAAELIYGFDESVEALRTVLYIFVGISVVIVITTIVLSASNSVKKSKTNIGILCALGVQQSNVASIFRMETMVTTGMSSVIYVLMLIVLRLILNRVYLNRHPGFSFELLYSNPILCVLIIAAIFVFSFVIIEYLVRKLMKMNPIDTLREE